jgi:DNA-binding transcriptional ArsR family regulator
MTPSEVLAALSAIAQETRLAIFRLLVQIGPAGMAASKIAEQLDIAPSSLSFHLKELTHAKLITARSEGRFIIYAADVAVMNGLVGYLTENCCGGASCGPSGCVTNPSASTKAERRQHT